MNHTTSSTGCKRASALLLAVAVLALATTISTAAAAGGKTVISVVGGPIWAVPAYGSVWVGTQHQGDVYRIDPATNAIVDTIGIPRPACGEPAVGFGALFISECTDAGGNTFELSTTTHKVVRQLAGSPAAVGGGSVWTVSPDANHVWRYDPKTGKRTASVATHVLLGAANVTVGATGGGSVWVGDQVDNTVIRASMATNTVTAVIPLPGAVTTGKPDQGHASGGQMLYAFGKLWAGNPAGVYVIDPSTNRATRLDVKIGNLWAWGDIIFSAGDGTVWVRNTDSAVTRLDPKTGKVLGTYPAAGGGGGPYVGNGSLWVSNMGANTVWREPLD
jgi:streptogramin lyase